MSYIVVGTGTSGVSAALELAHSGVPVSLVSYNSWESGNILDNYTIGPTPINEYEISALEFEHRVTALLHQAGVRYLDDKCWFVPYSAKTIRGRDQIELRDINNNSLIASAAVFAPNGSQPDLPARLKAKSLYGRGISTSATADAEFHEGRPVAVLGSGRHAVAQACILASCASSVTILCPSEAMRTTDFTISALTRFRNIRIMHQVEILSVMSGSNGVVTGLGIRQGSQNALMEISGLFLAQDPVVEWGLWGGQNRAAELVGHQLLFPTGLAAGIACDNDAALYQDGVRAARACVAASNVHRSCSLTKSQH